jgi:hypothetical protein
MAAAVTAFADMAWSSFSELPLHWTVLTAAVVVFVTTLPPLTSMFADVVRCVASRRLGA